MFTWKLALSFPLQNNFEVAIRKHIIFTIYIQNNFEVVVRNLSHQILKDYNNSSNKNQNCIISKIILIPEYA